MKYVFQFFIILLTLISCNSKSNLRVDSIDIDYSNQSGIQLNGKYVTDIVGGEKLIVIDSLMMIITKNPDAQLLIYNTNTLDNIGKLCAKGRSRNEFMKAITITYQAYHKNGHIVVPLIDYMDVVKEVDITESINQGRTIVISNESCQNYADGPTLFLDNDIYKRFELIYNKYDGEEIKKVPCKFSIKQKGQKAKEIKIFRRLVQVEKASQAQAPFIGMLLKQPSNNKLIYMFRQMDYILFFDIDQEKIFAVHKQGSRTFDDPLYYDKEYYFNGGCSTNNYAMLLYYHGEDSMKESDRSRRKAEVVIFDWNGGFIKNIKLDRRLASIGYDETNKKLFGLTFSEELYEFDLSTILP